jgi:Lrp/AsnC family leucine-responsive transcriptional regulator
MALQTDRQLDHTGWRLLRLLQENARSSFRQIGDLIGLTAPAVAERVRRLEDAGIIQGYAAEIDLAKIGLPILAYVHLTVNSANSPRFRADVEHIPEVIECHTVTGIESYILKVAVPSVPKLEHLLFKLKDYGDMRTSLILSSQVKRRIIDEGIVNGDTIP